MPERLPFHLADYLELVNWTGRSVCDDNRGAIAEDLPPILERIGITHGVAAAGQGLRDQYLQLGRSSRACRAGLPPRGSGLGPRHPRLPATDSQLSALSSLPELP